MLVLVLMLMLLGELRKVAVEELSWGEAPGRALSQIATTSRVRPEPTWGQLSIFTWCQHREGRGPAPKSTKMSYEMKPKNDCLDIL